MENNQDTQTKSVEEMGFHVLGGKFEGRNDSSVLSENVFGEPLKKIGNFDRIKAFEDIEETGKATIYCIYGSYGSGKSRLVSRMYCSKDNPIILDGDSFRYYVNNHLIIDDNDNVENAINMGRVALYFAMQGKDVIVDAVRGDMAYQYLVKTLQDIADTKTPLKNRYEQGVDIDVQLIKTEGVSIFNK